MPLIFANRTRGSGLLSINVIASVIVFFVIPEKWEKMINMWWLNSCGTLFALAKTTYTWQLLNFAEFEGKKPMIIFCNVGKYKTWLTHVNLHSSETKSQWYSSE